MVDMTYVESQLRKIGFGTGYINRAEIKELENILLVEEEIYECVNGYYEGGVALLVATDVRVLLIDKKPMGFLNVDDVRFDMISDIDYSHRFIGSKLTLNSGMSSLCFNSYNQERLRKLVGHIQHRMSEIKREQFQHASVQKQHLEDINRQLRTYLLAQQQQLEKQLAANQIGRPLKPSPQLADYLFAQQLLEEFTNQSKPIDVQAPQSQDQAVSEKADLIPSAVDNSLEREADRRLLEEMEEAGRLEVFGGTDTISHNKQPIVNSSQMPSEGSFQGIDMNPFKIAYAKLPYLLHDRRYHRGGVFPHQHAV